jgi:lysophospholipase
MGISTAPELYSGPTVVTRDGLSLALEHHFVPNAKAHVLVVHGFGEHMGRYRHVVSALTGAGYACHLFDLRGHGASEGARAYVAELTDFHDDLNRVAARVRQAISRSSSGVGTRPGLVALAHSMGGLLALDHTIRHPATFDALILSSPFFAEGFKVPALARACGLLMARMVPRWPLNARVDARLLSHDRTVVEAYTRDKRVLGFITPRLWREIGVAQREVVERAAEVRTPTLFLVGTADRVVDTAAIDRVFRALASHDKKLLTYDGFFHEVLNENGGVTVLADVQRWLDSRWGT